MPPGDAPLTVVTGSASGIGEAVARMAAARGHRVVGIDIGAPSEVFPSIRIDVGNAEAVARAIADIENAHGAIAGLVNAAGVLGQMSPPEELTIARWDRELSIDLTGTFLVAKAAGGYMAARGRGAIVNIASVAGMSAAPTLAYSAAKAGVLSLTANLARAWGRHGVRVNAVSPGFTLTPALERAFATGLLDGERIATMTALGRLVRTDEIAEAVLWLLSDASSAVTGINLPVDAGFLAGATWPAYTAAETSL